MVREDELVYIVEDDAAVARLLRGALEKYDFPTESFATGAALLERIRHRPPGVCILDLGLPDMDGLELVRRIRAHHAFGLLILTGRGDTHDRVSGLELGADDYMVKPFEPRELIARVRSILRRYRPAALAEGEPPRVAEFAGWRFDSATHVLTGPDGRSEDLSLAEATLLRRLLERPNQILSREQLLDGRSLEALDRSIDLRVSRLRKRLEDNSQHARLIKTVYGAGYLLCAEVRWS
ncbi:response regulator transcription factor [Pseudothauera rhizosphaerae]|uniref:Response regulator transcription factor n=1 Tax=Pseudothauera rhizosphaerae TaxID=2565932 RepID=A0A4S4ACN8_9RHOO|nr:response regulator transcription factor [Pseudothauera rhizosphaerae]THF56831.1 response regulator transcription factor [Pseudothauera rhizosphaerae]